MAESVEAKMLAQSRSRERPPPRVFDDFVGRVVFNVNRAVVDGCWGGVTGEDSDCER